MSEPLSDKALAGIEATIAFASGIASGSDGCSPDTCRRLAEAAVHLLAEVRRLRARPEPIRVVVTRERNFWIARSGERYASSASKPGLAVERLKKLFAMAVLNDDARPEVDALFVVVDG